MATKFTKDNLLRDGKYCFYCPDGLRTMYADRKFVCRFRTSGVATFMTHLRKNWTVEAYFAQLDEGNTPLGIVKQTGYLLPHIKRWLKEGGYPITQAGFSQMVKDQHAPAPGARGVMEVDRC